MRLLLPLLIVLLLFAVLAGRAAAAPSPPVLDELMAEALSHNPTIIGAEARAEMAANRVRPAGSLDDPTLSLSLNNFPVDSLRSNRSAMTGKVVKLAQKFPFPGKLAARRRAAALEAQAAASRYQAARLELASQVKTTYYRLYFIDQATAITEENRSLLDDVIRLTETNYAVGKGLQQDVLKAQVEHSRLADRLLSLRQQRATVLARLNELLGRDPATPLATAPTLEPPLLPPPDSDLLALAEGNHPAFAAARAKVEAAKMRVKLARLAYKPDFQLAGAWTQREPNMVDNGTDFASLTFGMTLPIFRAKRDDGLAEAQAGLRLAEAELARLRDRVGSAIADAVAGLDRGRSQVLLYREGIIPQANQTYEASMAAYQVGKISFLTLIDNLMVLYRYQTDYHRAVTEALESGATLERLVGLPLAGLDGSHECSPPRAESTNGRECTAG